MAQSTKRRLSLSAVLVVCVLPLFAQTQLLAIPLWLWHVLNVFVVLLLMLIGFYIAMKWLEQRAEARGLRRTHRLSLILHASHLSIWLYNAEEKKFYWYDKNGMMQRTYPLELMPQRVGLENYERLMASLHRVENQEKERDSVELYTHAESNLAGQKRIYVIDASVLRYHHGKPSVIIAVCSDVTEERMKQHQTEETLIRYRSVFNTAMIDMVYYDENGYITDMNERAQRNSRVSLQQAIRDKVNLYDIVDDLNFDQFDRYYATLFLDGNTGKFPLHCSKLKDNELYEMQLVPVRRTDGSISCIYGTGRNVTEQVSTYRALQQSVKDVERANKEITDYVKNMNFVLGVGGVRMTRYSLQSHTLIIYRSFDVVQLQLTQTRIMSLVDEQSKKTALRILNSLDNHTTASMGVEVKTTLRIHGKPLYLQFRFVPTFDERHHVTGYFGMCRDVSEIKATEVLLEKETARAQEVENLKNSFLRNMSYEIRNPMNAVVGFAELFEQDHRQEDEPLFIAEIKNNSAHLLHLINDILFLSRLDAQMIEMEQQEVDFASVFETHCQIGWGDEQKEGVSYIVENRYDKLVVVVDEVNIGRIIEQLTVNAAQHTDSGSVRARYDYTNGRLNITIEDTGCGMSEKTLSRVYERFASAGNKGTGLGLPICKELTDQLGGTIDIASQIGKGTTVWVSIPCRLISFERKTEV